MKGKVQINFNNKTCYTNIKLVFKNPLLYMIEKLGQRKKKIHTKFVRSVDSVRRAAEWWLPNLWLGLFSSQYFLDCYVLHTVESHGLTACSDPI